MVGDHVTSDLQRSDAGGQWRDVAGLGGRPAEAVEVRAVSNQDRQRGRHEPGATRRGITSGRMGQDPALQVELSRPGGRVRAQEGGGEKKREGEG